MISTRRPVASRTIRVISLTLCYSLIISAAFLPLDLSVKSVAATRAGKGSLKSNRTTNLVLQIASRRDGELLIRFRAGLSEQSKETLRTANGTKRKKQLRGESTVEKLEVLGGRSVETVALQLSLNPDVEFVEPNFIINKDQVATGDPQFGEQWALRNTGQGGGQFGSDINVTTAWQTTSGLESTTIAVIDSGIDLTHPDLTNNRWENPDPSPEGDINGWDYITDSADDHLLAYSLYNVDTSTGQTDCPRFTQRKDWAKYWNGDGDGVPLANEEATTTYAAAADNSWSKVTFPDLTIYKEFFATSGWQTGMTTSTKNFANAADETANLPKKSTTITWTQDDESLTFPKNPRVAETNITDAEGNHKRVTVNYGAYAPFSLPYEVKEYAADAVTVVRRTLTDYNLSSTYLDRRIIGLVSAVNVIDQASGATVSKTTLDYDWTGEYLTQTPVAAIRHDDTNYGAGFVAGRGNLSAVTRWDVTDINNAAKAIQQQRIGYNYTGAPIFSRDALGHQTSTSYTDQFSAGGDRNSFAYPTTMTDAESFQSKNWYNFDFGAITLRQTPAPNGGTPPSASFTYDLKGRITKITNDLNTAFTEWVYPDTMMEFNQFTTIDPGSICNAALRAFSTTFLDGAGRTRATAVDHPGSAGLYSGQYVVFDNMGRTYQTSNPTEITASWIPAGDDAVSGWRSTQQTYDWKGRPTVTTNADGTTRVATYGGCGCAGGEVATLQDKHGRQRRLTKDTLGRLWKVEELNWNTTVYALTTYSYNMRDQLTESNQATQLRSFTYDGYGRLSSRTTPEQGTTSYNYNLDDTTNFITDARGAKTIFGYNPRHLVSSISYDLSNLVPGQSVAATPNVSNITYDPAGNRKTMNDGLGGVTYGYNNLSQLTSETRTFNGVAGSFTLSYSYNLAGELASMTDQWAQIVNYGYDKVGRVTGVTGPGSPNYATNLTYRAFGSIKGMSYGDGKSLSALYDNRMRPTRWDVSTILGYNYNYDYFNEHTGRVTYAGSI